MSATDTPTADAADKEECGWCKWMKAGGCGEQFEVWQKCVDAVRDAGREDVETCSSVMGPLWDCMQKNAEYYTPQVEALNRGRADAEASGSGKDAEAAAAPAQGSGGGGGSIDIDNITDKDIEQYLENLDKEEEGQKQKS